MLKLDSYIIADMDRDLFPQLRGCSKDWMRREMAVLVADFDLQHCKHIPIRVLGRNHRRLLSILVALVGHCKVHISTTDRVLIILLYPFPLNHYDYVCVNYVIVLM